MKPQAVTTLRLMSPRLFRVFCAPKKKGDTRGRAVYSHSEPARTKHLKAVATMPAQSRRA